MRRRRLLGFFERIILGAAMGAALRMLEKRLNRRQARH